MNRIVTYQLNPVILSTLSMIPDCILDRLYFDWIIGSDPIFMGLHDYEDGNYDRSYHNTAHVAFPCHQLINKSERKTTIIIPDVEDMMHPCLIVHEIGHVLDEYIGHDFEAIPITEYAKDNREEAFAEAFTAWLCRDYAEIDLHTQSGIDPATNFLFDRLKIF